MAPHSGCGSAVKTMDYLVCQQDSTALKTEWSLVVTGRVWPKLLVAKFKQLGSAYIKTHIVIKHC